MGKKIIGHVLHRTKMYHSHEISNIGRAGGVVGTRDVNAPPGFLGKRKKKSCGYSLTIIYFNIY